MSSTEVGELINGYSMRIWRLTVFITLSLWMSVACSKGGYQAIIDAGSSGSRIYLYKLSEKHNRLHIETLLAFRPSSSKGLSAHKNIPEQAGPNEIAPLLKNLKTTLESINIDQKSVPISVLATAGMRLLPESVTKRIFNSVTSEISAQGWRLQEARVISGQEEGVFAWIDLNYSRDRLRPGRETFGVIEIGGASSQVAFASTDFDATNSLPFTINGLRYQVVSISYLGLGHNEARHSMMRLIGNHQPGSNPCYPNSGQADVTFDAGRIKGQLSLFSEQCFDLFERVIDRVGQQTTNQPSPDNLKEIPGYVSTPFIGLAAIKHVLEQWTVDERLTPKIALRQAIMNQCSGPDAWERFRHLKGSRSLVQNACASASYLYALLFSNEGLALSAKQFETLGHLQKDGLSWTRGFVLYRATQTQ